MPNGPVIAAVAALVGDPARANMLTALMDGRALTVSELAAEAGVALPTASGHLTRLEEAKLITATRQGRHRYLRLSGHDVAEVLESLMSLAERTGAVRTRPGPKDPALREARVCYDHLAGARGVALLDGFVARCWVTQGERPSLTDEGRTGLAKLGLNLAPLARTRRLLCRPCLDWSERRSHMGGALGAALLDHLIGAGWARRGAGRTIRFTVEGAHSFDAAFG